MMLDLAVTVELLQFSSRKVGWLMKGVNSVPYFLRFSLPVAGLIKLGDFLAFPNENGPAALNENFARRLMPQK